MFYELLGLVHLVYVDTVGFESWHSSAHVPKQEYILYPFGIILDLHSGDADGKLV